METDNRQGFLAQRKNFQAVLQNPANYSDYTPPPPPTKDPNVFSNTAVIKEIQSKLMASVMVNSGLQTLFSVFYSPLTVASTLLQLSVLPHQNKYGDVSPTHSNNYLAHIPKEITAQDRRRYELIVKSGVTGSNKPFRAPVFTSYREAFLSIANQGVLGYFKGNFLGIVHKSASTSFKYRLNIWSEFSNNQYLHENKLFKTLMFIGGYTLIDIMIHPLELLQTRFILQNRLPNFRTYDSLKNLIMKKMRRPWFFYQGWTIHLPKNILMGYTYVNLFPNNPFLSLMIANYLGFFLTYPLMTVGRRLMCQCNDPGMIPVRYEGAWHGLKLVFIEEGIRGLYRGIAGYSVANAIMVSVAYLSRSIGDELYESAIDRSLK